MSHLQKDGPEDLVYKGQIFEVIKQPMKAGDKKVMFEIARRGPGTRLIIVKDDKILLTKEWREELQRYDYRLPGGKVFDTLDEYNQHRNDDILDWAIKAAKRECREETGLIVKSIKHFATTQAGATVIWNLFYFIVDDFETHAPGQELETGENITTEWKTFAEVKNLCENGGIGEDRTMGVLFKFFLKYSK